MTDAASLFRLNKFISDTGYCSRREADALIAELEHEFARFAALSPQPEAMTATRGAEAHLVRGVRSIVIAEMLHRVS